MIDDILIQFNKNSNSDNARAMNAYLKNKFEFFGVKSPLRKELSKPIFVQVKNFSREGVIKLVQELWSRPERELHYLAQEIMFKNLKKKWEEEDIQLIEWLAVNNSWWDTIDFIAPKLMADYFLLYPKQIEVFIQKWLNSGNFWLVRCAILFQLKYREKTNLELLYKVILECFDTKEFFVNKSIGWVLRENSKRIPAEIKDFVQFHNNQLSNLSKREALRLIE